MAATGRTVREGVVVGLIGYAAVAAFFTLFDLLGGRGWVFTLNLLGQVLFRGVRDPAVLQLPMPPDVGAMVLYNFFHLLAALTVGMFVAWLVEWVEEGPSLSRGRTTAAVLVAGYVLTVAVVAWLSRDLGPLLPVWTVVVVNTLAALGGGIYLWRLHPGLWERLRES